MPKRILTADERKKIIDLRQTGAGWMEIQRRTGVARRTALRVFSEWEATRQVDNQREARQQVVSQEFERHMRDLVSLAEHLISGLELPTPSDVMSGNDIERRLLELDIRLLREGELGELSATDAERVVRRNRLLLHSLREHTVQGVDWDVYDRWRAARNSWAACREKLVSAAYAVLRNVADDETSGGRRTLLNDKEASRIAEGLAQTLLCALSQNALSQSAEHVTVQQHGDAVYLTLGCGRDAMQFQFQDAAVAESVAQCCRRSLDTLVRGHDAGILKQLDVEYKAMTAARSTLVDALEELRLIPLILKTRCEFCPA